MSCAVPVPGLLGSPAVYHYAADRHALELRCAFDGEAWARCCQDADDVVLVALTSIHWREAWKYGERAFRYCQHDLGHAIAAVASPAGMLGWRRDAVAGVVARSDSPRLTGIDRDEDFIEAEREEPGCAAGADARRRSAGIWTLDERLSRRNRRRAAGTAARAS